MYQLEYNPVSPRESITQMLKKVMKDADREQQESNTLYLSIKECCFKQHEFKYMEIPITYSTTHCPFTTVSAVCSGFVSFFSVLIAIVHDILCLLFYPLEKQKAFGVNICATRGCRRRRQSFPI